MFVTFYFQVLALVSLFTEHKRLVNENTVSIDKSLQMS